MAESFSFSKDWYYWSQDRLGSLLPLTAFALKSVFPLSVIWSVSIAQWFYLLLGLVSFWYFIPNRWMRLLLAVLWFFPFYALVFHVLPGHPYAAQMAMLGCSFVCFHQAILKSKTSYLPLMVLFAVLAIWVSDFSAFIYLSLMLFYRTQILSQLKKTIQSKQGIIRLSSAMFVFLVGCAGLYYAKTHTFKDPNYISQLFANPEELTHTILTLWSYVVAAASFEADTAWNSIGFYASIGLFALSVYKRSIPKTSWISYFLITAVLGFIFIMLLRWFSINYVMLKYMIPLFLLFWVALFATVHAKSSLTNASIWISSLISISSVFSFRATAAIGPERRISYEDLKSIDTNRTRYFIADYWYSYVLGICNPSKVIITPREQQFVRNGAMKDQVMHSDTIIIVKTGWLDHSNPDTLMQFGVPLVFTGKVWEEGRFSFAAYLNSNKD